MQFKVTFTVHEILLLLGECLFNILCMLESPGELLLEIHRGYDLTGLKWDGPNDLTQPTTTSLRGKVGASSFIKTQ